LLLRSNTFIGCIRRRSIACLRLGLFRLRGHFALRDKRRLSLWPMCSRHRGLTQGRGRLFRGWLFRGPAAVGCLYRWRIRRCFLSLAGRSGRLLVRWRWRLSRRFFRRRHSGRSLWPERSITWGRQRWFARAVHSRMLALNIGCRICWLPGTSLRRIDRRKTARLVRRLGGMARRGRRLRLLRIWRRYLTVGHWCLLDAKCLLGSLLLGMLGLRLLLLFSTCWLST